MEHKDAVEAEPIVTQALDTLLEWAPTQGRPGADLRSAVGHLKLHVMAYLHDDVLGPPLLECFALACETGINLMQMDNVRQTAAAQVAISVGAITVRGALIELSLASEARILAAMTFRSRQEVEALKLRINEIFTAMEEETADAMDAMTYRALISLHAAVTFHLIETARPLPRLLRFEFGLPMPTLLIAHRLYADAGRAEELLAENHVVHPAFAPRFGRALSQ
jgi:prophage DNA circulation protein